MVAATVAAVCDRRRLNAATGSAVIDRRYRRGRLLAVAILFLIAHSATAALRVPLFVVEDQGVARHGEPVAGGIPFSKGAVLDPDQIVVSDAKGKLIPSQAHQLGISWPDGSLKWALVQFQADVPANQTARFNLAVRKTKPLPGALTVREEADRVEVSTGPMRFAVSRADCRLPNQVWVDGELIIPDGARLELIADREAMTPAEFAATGQNPYALGTFGTGDQGGHMWNSANNTTVFTNIVWNKLERGIDYSRFLTGPVNITVEERGPVRCVLRIESAAEKREGEIGFVARLYAYAGQKQLRVEMTVENYERVIPVAAEPYTVAIVNVKHIRRLTYRLQPAFGPAERVEFGTDSGSAPIMTLCSAAVRQLASNAWSLSRANGFQLDHGARAPGWLAVGKGARSLALAPKYFWETCPKGVAYDHDNGAVTLELWPAAAPAPGYPLAAGRQRTYEFVLGFDTPGNAASALARAELRPYPAPEYVAGTGATHRFVPLDDARFSSYATYVEKTVARQMGRRLYGDLEFGDQVSHAPYWRWSNYHGVSHEWFMFYLASGRPEFFRFAESVVEHSVDVDTQHWGDEVGSHESEFARSEVHTVAAPNQGGIKVWNYGEVDDYFLTGNRRVWETLVKTARYLKDCPGMIPPDLFGQRATSLPFMHLANTYEAVGDERALAELFPKLYSPQRRYPPRGDSVGVEESLAMMRRLKEVSDHLSGLMATKKHDRKVFFFSYAADGFYRFWSLTRDPRAARGVVDTANFLYHDLILPTGMPRYTVGPPDEEWAAFQPHADEVDLPATRAYQVTRDRRYLDYGKASVDWILNYRGIANHYTGFGSTLPEFLWSLRDAGLTQRDLARMRRDIDYDQAVAETKAIALAKYDLAPSGESRAYCLLAEEVGRVLINQGRYDEALEWLAHWQKNNQAYDIQPFIERAKARKKEESQ